MNPDQVVSVHNVQVLTRPASDISRVTFDMEIRFTHLYDLPPVVFVDNVLTVVNEYLTALAAAAGNDHTETTTTTTQRTQDTDYTYWTQFTLICNSIAFLQHP
jgi:hypothetical protein